MSVAVLLVTHARLGHDLLGTVTEVMGAPPLPTDVMEVKRVLDTDALVRQGARLVERLDRGGGVLILTDAYGSTPSNIANRIAEGRHARVVAGLNLPMLVSVYNYPALDLEAQARNAVSSGRDGILLCRDGDSDA
ncbi:MAG TPA: PTS fructose transporter subunit IIA [Nevskiales bacterium]|nr:PTS fructose transporter subunit IIA [Nevskiales bacterium]